MATNDGLSKEKILLKENNTILLEFEISKKSDFFDGHFPEYKLLPAVGQFYIVIHFAEKYFNISNYVPDFRRIKFSAPVRPDSVLHLQITYRKEKKNIKFSLLSKDEKTTYSIGSFSVLEMENIAG